MDRGVVHRLSRVSGPLSPTCISSPPHSGELSVLRRAVHCVTHRAELPTEAASRKYPGVADITATHNPFSLDHGIGHRPARLCNKAKAVVVARGRRRLLF